MITSAELARLRIVRAIFHDVPERPKNIETKVTLADLETTLNPKKSQILRDRITDVLDSTHAYTMHFSPQPETNVPQLVRGFTATGNTPPKTEQERSAAFVAVSRHLAESLFAKHTGVTSAGLLCVLEVAIGNDQGLVLLKLERQEGAEIIFKGEEGQKVFDFDVLENLILTDDTRLFKSAAFIRTGGGDDDFKLGGCDSQGPGTSEDVARFWLTYLGCQLAEEPRVSTRKWFEASLAFANEVIVDPVEKNSFYEHIHSELKSNRKDVSPRKFIQDSVPAAFRAPYAEFLGKRRVSLRAFRKDTSEIKSRLRRKALLTSCGIRVVVPEEQDRLVDVEAHKIVVNDQLESVDHK